MKVAALAFVLCVAVASAAPPPLSAIKSWTPLPWNPLPWNPLPRTALPEPWSPLNPLAQPWTPLNPLAQPWSPLAQPWSPLAQPWNPLAPTAAQQIAQWEELWGLPSSPAAAAAAAWQRAATYGLPLTSGLYPTYNDLLVPSLGNVVVSEVYSSIAPPAPRSVVIY